MYTQLVQESTRKNYIEEVNYTFMEKKNMLIIVRFQRLRQQTRVNFGHVHFVHLSQQCISYNYQTLKIQRDWNMYAS